MEGATGRPLTFARRTTMAHPTRRLFLGGLLLGLLALGLALRPALATAASAYARTRKPVYQAGESIQVDFNDFFMAEKDGVTIVPTGTPDDEYGEFKFVPRGTGGFGT